MIEISHQQARFLIRRSADRRLPDEQWTALQAHLERCASCRAVSSRQNELERAMRRGLLARWRPVDGPLDAIAPQVIRFRSERSERRKTAGYGLFGLVAALLILLFANMRSSFVETQNLAAVQNTASPTAPLPTPTIPPEGRFAGVIAYQSSEEGSSDIYLVNAGPGGSEKINLTAHPAEDIHPSWSPDGEWLAFLSDRSGKNELYVISIAGTRLTRLTLQPDLAWEGIPEWSGDGKWIALTGRRLSQDGDAWVYLIPLDGSVPVSLPGTRGASGGTRFSEAPSLLSSRFSPVQPMLAARTGDGGLSAYSLLTSWRRPAVSMEEFPDGAVLAGFDWAFGDSLVYLISGPQGSTVIIHGPFGPRYPVSANDSLNRTLVRSSAELYSSLAFQPGGQAVAVLPASGDCRVARLLYAFVFDEAQAAELHGLCIFSELDHTSWHHGGSRSLEKNWLVVAARPEDDPAGEAALYAMYVPGKPENGAGMYVERLAPLSPLGDGALPVPRARPLGSSLNIQPVGADARPPVAAPPADEPAGMHGSLLLVEPGKAETDALLLADPVGGSRTPLLTAESAIRCPAWSPDRSMIAFLSDRSWREASHDGMGFPQRGPDEVFVMDAATGEITQLTSSSLTGRAASLVSQGFTCPSWSPDGKYLAVVSTVGQGGGLMVLTPQGQVAYYGPSGRPTPYSSPVWTPDGEAIVFAQQAVSGGAPLIVGVRWRDLSAAGVLNWNSRTLELDGWDDVQGLSISPDGESLAYIVVRHAADGRAARASLRVYSLSYFETSYIKILAGYDPLTALAPSHIVWTSQGELVYAQPLGPLTREKAVLVRINPTNGAARELAYLEDELHSWSLSGAWLVYSSESGLWGLPVASQPGEPVSPLRLSSGAPDEVVLSTGP